MDKIAFEKLMKEMLKNKPAKIIAESDDKGKMSISFEGRGIEIFVMSLEISRKVIETSHLSVDDYYEISKMIKHQDKSKEQEDVENVIINKMLGDIFK